MASTHFHRNNLVGLVAFRMGIIDESQYRSALNTCLNPPRDLEEVLLEQNFISANNYKLFKEMVKLYLEMEVGTSDKFTKSRIYLNLFSKQKWVIFPTIKQFRLTKER